MSENQEENLYTRPTSAFIPTQPQDQEDEITQEEIEINSNVGLIRELVSHLESRVGYFASVDSIPYEVLTNANEHMHLTLAHKLTKDILAEELRQIRETMNAYGKPV